MLSLEWVLIQYDWCPYKKTKVPGERDTAQTPGDDRGRERSHAKACQAMPDIDGDN